MWTLVCATQIVNLECVHEKRFLYKNRIHKKISGDILNRRIQAASFYDIVLTSVTGELLYATIYYMYEKPTAVTIKCKPMLLIISRWPFYFLLVYYHFHVFVIQLHSLYPEPNIIAMCSF